MKTLKFKLYQHKRNRYLKRTINAAGVIYNHCVALHKRYYRMWGKHLNCAQLKKHIAKLRKRNKFWQLVGSQAVQDKRLWGRKISDLAFGEFIEILEWVATKKGKLLVFIDQWYPSSKTCFHCNHVLEKLELTIREWRCPSCSSINGRDENASLNIKRVGASTLKLDGVRQEFPATVV